MTEDTSSEKHSHSHSPELSKPLVEDGPGLMEAIRFLMARRSRLALLFAGIFAICSAWYLVGYFRGPRSVDGIVGLDFSGIERHQYPSGRKFSVEDFRSPEVLRRALREAGIAESTMGIRDLASKTTITPVIPAEIESRWKKQEREGSTRESYYPNEFKITVSTGSLDSLGLLRLFDSLVKSYQQRVKFEQNAAFGFVASWNLSYEDLAKTYDPWDVPALFRQTFDGMNSQLAKVLSEAMQTSDPSYQIVFREIGKQLHTWEATRLMAIEALTYQGRLVRNRELIERRINYQIEDLDIRIKQNGEETTEAMRLLEVVDRPRATLAGSLSNQGGMPLVDATALDRLVKADYVGPLVQRISRLQEGTTDMQSQKARLQRQLAMLPKATGGSPEQLPAGYKELVESLSTELGQIVGRFNKELDEYLAATVTGLVSVRRAPTVGRVGYSPILMLAAILALSALLAVLALAAEHVIRKARTGV